VGALLDRFEKLIAGALVVLMAIVVLAATVELARLVVVDLITPPMALDITELLDLFGFFMLILIGLELIETIRAYLAEHVVHAEVVVEVAIIAIARKVIILDMKEYESLSLIGIAAIVVALTIAYYTIKRTLDRQRAGAARADHRSP
jgi:uncharacterized membrane protein (DUF373 family)